MSKPDLSRDFWLIANRAAIWDTVAGNAAAAIAVMPNRFTDRSYARVAAVGEMLDRYEALAFAVGPSLATYRPDMGEAELREWANALVSTLR